MKRLVLFFATILLFNIFYGQEVENISIGKRLKITSEILNSEREISVQLPSSYKNNTYTRYPVLYLLDGRKFFNSFSGVLAQLSSDASPQVPEMIVVGVTSQDRIRDSSPTHSLIGYTKTIEEELEVSGGADHFLKFIQNELIPYVEANYRTNSFRTIVGYSFTGLPVLQALFTMPESFNAYLVIDFSAWWDDEIMTERLKEFSKTYKGPTREVFLTTVDRVTNTVYTETYNPVWKFIQEFEQIHPSDISFSYKKYGYKQENHHSLPLVSFIDGIKYIFRGHMINYDEMYNNPKLIDLKFTKLSRRLGYHICLPESLINHFGHLFLRSRPDIEKALFYFEYNTKNYPLSTNAWINLAEAYIVKGDRVKAIEIFESYLNLNPNDSKIKKRVEEFKKLN